MAVSLETREAQRGFNCPSCGGRTRTCEKYLQVVKNGKAIRGERYCIHCERIARLNNPEIGEDEAAQEDDGESHLRSMEDFAAYRAAGCTHAYYDDRDAGYAH